MKLFSFISLPLSLSQAQICASVLYSEITSAYVINLVCVSKFQTHTNSKEPYESDALYNTFGHADILW
jgi:hypothetical protein